MFGRFNWLHKSPDSTQKNLQKTPSNPLNQYRNPQFNSKNSPLSQSFFGISVQNAVQGEPKNTLNEPDIRYQKRIPEVVTIDALGNENILYVPIKAQAGYLTGHGDKEYIETLPTFRMPGLNNATYRMFEVQGLSMSPTLMDRDRVICEWVPSFNEIRENRVHVIVTTKGILIKRVLNRIENRNVLYLKSDTITHRNDYPLIELAPEDVIELWYVQLKVSSDLSEPSEVYTRISDLEIQMKAVLNQLGLNESGA